MKDPVDVIAGIVCQVAGRAPDEIIEDGGGSSWPLVAEVKTAVQTALSRAGLVIVPVEPTGEIRRAFFKAHDDARGGSIERFDVGYRAGIAAYTAKPASDEVKP